MNINNEKIFTLEDALEEGRVFVVNKSKPKGNVLITFVHPSSGQSFSSKIPKTWIPIAISDSVPTQVIKESVDFRSYLRSQMLVLIPKNRAESILSSSDAKEELARLYTSKYSDKRKEPKDTENSVEVTQRKDIQNYIKEENLIVKDILERNIDNKASVTLNELKSVQEELSRSDYVYVIKNTEGKIRAWAEKIINDLT